MTKLVAIVPQDRLLGSSLDEVARRLAKDGVEVLRPAAAAPEDWGDDLARADVIALTPRTAFARREMDAAPRLKGVAFPTIGVEALDLDAANRVGLAVGFGATPELVESMAEANVLLFAALLLDLPGKQRSLRESGWRDGSVSARMLRGKTVGFVGYGRIARATVARLAGWGVRPVFYDPHVAADGSAEKIAGLATLLRISDVVTILVELTPRTVGLIGADELRLMKPDAFLVNTGRGQVVDQDALIRCLAARQIAGAALDAFAIEPLAAGSPLRALDNVILTPHNIGHTQEQVASFADATYENMIRIARGEPPLYFKNPQVLDAWRARLARLPA